MASKKNSGSSSKTNGSAPANDSSRIEFHLFPLFLILNLPGRPAPQLVLQGPPTSEVTLEWFRDIMQQVVIWITDHSAANPNRQELKNLRLKDELAALQNANPSLSNLGADQVVNVNGTVNAAPSAGLDAAVPAVHQDLESIVTEKCEGMKAQMLAEMNRRVEAEVAKRMLKKKKKESFKSVKLNRDIHFQTCKNGLSTHQSLSSMNSGSSSNTNGSAPANDYSHSSPAPQLVVQAPSTSGATFAWSRDVFEEFVCWISHFSAVNRTTQKSENRLLKNAIAAHRKALDNRGTEQVVNGTAVVAPSAGLDAAVPAVHQDLVSVLTKIFEKLKAKILAGMNRHVEAEVAKRTLEKKKKTHKNGLGKSQSSSSSTAEKPSSSSTTKKPSSSSTAEKPSSSSTAKEPSSSSTTKKPSSSSTTKKPSSSSTAKKPSSSRYQPY